MPDTFAADPITLICDHGGLFQFEVASFTTGAQWHTAIDCHDLTVLCDCPDFSIRRGPGADRAGIVPNLFDDKSICKHIRACARLLIAAGRIELADYFKFPHIENREQ